MPHHTTPPPSAQLPTHSESVLNSGMIVQYALPALTALLWVKPLVEFAAIPADVVLWARAGGLLASGALQLALFRGYLQV